MNESVSSSDNFINMMNTLLSTHKTYQEKRSALENTYHISMSYDLGKELSKMDHVLDDVIEEKLAEGLAKGLAKGRSEGFSEGRSKAKKEVVINLLKLNSISDKEILEVADISLEELQQIKDEMTALV